MQYLSRIEVQNEPCIKYNSSMHCNVSAALPLFLICNMQCRIKINTEQIENRKNIQAVTRCVIHTDWLLFHSCKNSKGKENYQGKMHQNTLKDHGQ
jgi:hypothetical protein